jgi:hypothetical protein
MQAAERIFDGQFDDVDEDGDVQMGTGTSNTTTDVKRGMRLAVCLWHPCFIVMSD